MTKNQRDFNNFIHSPGCVLDDNKMIDYAYDLRPTTYRNPTVSNKPNHTACATWCAETFQCTHWTFDRVSTECRLKRADGGSRHKSDDSSKISGNRACGCIRQQNVDYIGDAIKDGNRVNAEACADWCGVLFLAGNQLYDI